jgi:enoyl-CoA hydratase
VGERTSYELQDGVATIAMDDGKVNVLSNEMLAEVNGALDRAVADRAVVILTGRPGIFSAGFNLPVLQTGGPDARAMLNSGFELAERLLSFPTPVVIACPGHAIAMAAFLLLSGDYRIGTAGPYRIVANEVAIGLTMPKTAIELCRQRLTPAHFVRAVTLSEVYSPDGAIAAGFLDQVAPPDGLDEAAHEVASRLATLAPEAYTVTKRRATHDTLAAVHAALEADAQEFATP